jgi:hypothetical protein
MLGHHPAGVGEDQVATGPLHQGDAERGLEGGQVLGGGPGRVAEVLGRGGQGSSTHQLTQGAELGQVQPAGRGHTLTLAMLMGWRQVSSLVLKCRSG